MENNLKIFFKVWLLNLVTVSMFLTLGCANLSKQNTIGREKILAKAKNQSWQEEIIATYGYKISSLHKNLVKNQKAIIYFEGDGNSWKTKYQVSDDPTPNYPLALALALQDERTNVIYLARPCQYQTRHIDKSCNKRIWTYDRYSQEIIQAYSELLNKLKTQYNIPSFDLIGFSGGAAIATLLASKRLDITSIITVAGNLDHEALSKFHGTTPLYGSLNPIDNAYKLKGIPQLHLIGKKDKIITVESIESFNYQVNDYTCSQVKIIENGTHHSPWPTIWPKVIAEDLTCIG